MPRYKNPPIKRHPALQPLSRDHYVELVQARYLMKSADKSAIERRAAVDAFLDNQQDTTLTHFQDEERLLIPLMDGSDVRRLRRDHAQLRNFIKQAYEKREEVDPGREWVRGFGRMIHEHTRWEERELFPAIEKRATSDQLESLEQRTRLLEAERPRGRG